MSDNKIKDPVLPPEEVSEEKEPRKKRTIKPSRSFVRFMNMFGIFNRNQIVHSMPFILFVTVLIIGYIANSYYAERIIRDIDKTKNDLKENRAQYISTLSRLMYQSNQSEVARSLKLYEVNESTEPPVKIIVSDKEEKSE